MRNTKLVRGLAESLLRHKLVFPRRGFYVLAIVIALCEGLVFPMPLQTQQTPETKPQFEVVSIRPNRSGTSGNIGFLQDGYRGENVVVAQLILGAYGLKRQYQLVGLPKWAKSARYDIAAKVRETDVPMMKTLRYSELYKMFKPVLENRFSLRGHFEKRTLPAYTLRMSEKNDQLEKLQSTDHSKPVRVGEANLGAGALMKTASGKVVARAVRIQQLASFLADEMDIYVVDGTGLTGEYDFEMQLPHAGEHSFFSANHSSFSANDDLDSTHTPNQIDSDDLIQDGLYQIGLKLVPSKIEQPVLVIEELKSPSPN